MVTTENSEYFSIEWSGDLIDAPPTVKNYGTTRFRPIAVKVSYRRRYDQWSAFKAEIIGPALKSDGTDGKNIVSSDYYLDLSARECPAWLVDIATRYTPGAVQ